MQLKDSLENFVKVFGRGGTDIGNISINMLPKLDEDTLDSFYDILIFNQVLVIGGEMSMSIQPLDKQEKAQEGWGIILKDNVLVKDELHWNEAWIVFANRNDDAIYFNKQNGKFMELSIKE